METEPYLVREHPPMESRHFDFGLMVIVIYWLTRRHASKQRLCLSGSGSALCGAGVVFTFLDMIWRPVIPIFNGFVFGSELLKRITHQLSLCPLPLRFK